MKMYEAHGNPNEADCVIGFSFGTSIDTESVNAQLGTAMLRLANGRPVFADRTLVEAIPDYNNQTIHVIEGKPTHGVNQGLTTQGIWAEAQSYMKDNGLSRPLIVAQAYHISRVQRQGAKLGIQSIITPNMPTDFDRKSKQFWTRSVFLWVPVNAATTLFLKMRNAV